MLYFYLISIAKAYKSSFCFGSPLNHVALTQGNVVIKLSKVGGSIQNAFVMIQQVVRLGAMGSSQHWNDSKQQQQAKQKIHKLRGSFT